MLNLTHKNLEAFKSSKQLCKEVYLIANQFPIDEKFNLTSQLKRASISVCSNIAEGSSRKSVAERKRFYEISRGSIVEIDTQIEIALMLNLITKEQLEVLKPHVISTFKLLTGLINKQQ
ncbi:MAG: four helix bundle protein [Sphingobacteriales bacterium]|nr:four helix bundle protein [Sphingobacteriales bacterium]